jgi:hypothetical protein
MATALQIGFQDNERAMPRPVSFNKLCEIGAVRHEMV